MIDTFSFTPFPQIYFGRGELLKLAARLSINSPKVLLITGSSSLEKSGLLSSFLENLESHSLAYEQFVIGTEPSPQLIDQAVTQFKSAKVDTVVGIGGGSVLDAGKAIAAMLPLGESVADYLEGVGDKSHSGETLPFIAVPTSAGTGSEATKNAVISSVGQDGFKKSLRHDNFIPVMAVIDPELMVSCPPALTAACGMDAITQLLESYVSTKANPISDALAFGALEKCISSFPKVMHDGADLEARADMAYGALISGITLANAGLGVVHGFAGPIGGFFDIPHGVVCGRLLPAATEKNLERLHEKNDQEHEARLLKHVKVARLFDETQGMSYEKALQFMVTTFYRWLEDFKVPQLSSYGFSEQDIERIVQSSGFKNNPVCLSDEDLRDILKQSL
jgi:alcohol dehydrogenase